MAQLTIRKYADKSEGSREVVYVGDERRLVNPETPGDVHEPWPLAGVEIEGEPPAETTLPQRYAMQARQEGWLTLENATTVYRPAAPLDDPALVPPHVFIHADAVIIHCQSGDVRYRVTKQPDKYVDTNGADAETRVTDEIYAAGQTRVDAFYELALEG